MKTQEADFLKGRGRAPPRSRASPSGLASSAWASDARGAAIRPTSPCRASVSPQRLPPTRDAAAIGETPRPKRVSQECVPSSRDLTKPKRTRRSRKSSKRRRTLFSAKAETLMLPVYDLRESQDSGPNEIRTRDNSANRTVPNLSRRQNTLVYASSRVGPVRAPAAELPHSPLRTAPRELQRGDGAEASGGRKSESPALGPSNVPEKPAPATRGPEVPDLRTPGLVKAAAESPETQTKTQRLKRAPGIICSREEKRRRCISGRQRSLESPGGRASDGEVGGRTPRESDASQQAGSGAQTTPRPSRPGRASARLSRFQERRRQRIRSRRASSGSRGGSDAGRGSPPRRAPPGEEVRQSSPEASSSVPHASDPPRSDRSPPPESALPVGVKARIAQFEARRRQEHLQQNGNLGKSSGGLHNAEPEEPGPSPTVSRRPGKDTDHGPSRKVDADRESNSGGQPARLGAPESPHPLPAAVRGTRTGTSDSEKNHHREEPKLQTEDRPQSPSSNVSQPQASCFPLGRLSPTGHPELQSAEKPDEAKEPCQPSSEDRALDMEATPLQPQSAPLVGICCASCSSMCSRGPSPVLPVSVSKAVQVSPSARGAVPSAEAPTDSPQPRPTLRHRACQTDRPRITEAPSPAADSLPLSSPPPEGTSAAEDASGKVRACTMRPPAARPRRLRHTPLLRRRHRQRVVAPSSPSADSLGSDSASASGGTPTDVRTKDGARSPLSKTSPRSVVDGAVRLTIRRRRRSVLWRRRVADCERLFSSGSETDVDVVRARAAARSFLQTAERADDTSRRHSSSSTDDSAEPAQMRTEAGDVDFHSSPDKARDSSFKRQQDSSTSRETGRNPTAPAASDENLRNSSKLMDDLAHGENIVSGVKSDASLSYASNFDDMPLDKTDRDIHFREGLDDENGSSSDDSDANMFKDISFRSDSVFRFANKRSTTGPRKRKTNMLIGSDASDIARANAVSNDQDGVFDNGASFQKDTGKVVRRKSTAFKYKCKELVDIDDTDSSSNEDFHHATSSTNKKTCHNPTMTAASDKSLRNSSKLIDNLAHVENIVSGNESDAGSASNLDYRSGDKTDIQYREGNTDENDSICNDSNVFKDASFLSDDVFRSLGKRGTPGPRKDASDVSERGGTDTVKCFSHDHDDVFDKEASSQKVTARVATRGKGMSFFKAKLVDTDDSDSSCDENAHHTMANSATSKHGKGPSKRRSEALVVDSDDSGIDGKNNSTTSLAEDRTVCANSNTATHEALASAISNGRKLVLCLHKLKIHIGPPSPAEAPLGESAGGGERPAKTPKSPAKSKGGPALIAHPAEGLLEYVVRRRSGTVGAQSTAQPQKKKKKRKGREKRVAKKSESEESSSSLDCAPVEVLEGRSDQAGLGRASNLHRSRPHTKSKRKAPSKRKAKTVTEDEEGHGSCHDGSRPAAAGSNKLAHDRQTISTTVDSPTDYHQMSGRCSSDNCNADVYKAASLQSGNAVQFSSMTGATGPRKSKSKVSIDSVVRNLARKNAVQCVSNDQNGVLNNGAIFQKGAGKVARRKSTPFKYTGKGIVNVDTEIADSSSNEDFHHATSSTNKKAGHNPTMTAASDKSLSNSSKLIDNLARVENIVSGNESDASNLDDRSGDKTNRDIQYREGNTDENDSICDDSNVLKDASFLSDGTFRSLGTRGALGVRKDVSDVSERGRTDTVKCFSYDHDDVFDKEASSQTVTGSVPRRKKQLVFFKAKSREFVDTDESDSSRDDNDHHTANFAISKRQSEALVIDSDDSGFGCKSNSTTSFTEDRILGATSNAATRSEHDRETCRSLIVPLPTVWEEPDLSSVDRRAHKALLQMTFFELLVRQGRRKRISRRPARRMPTKADQDQSTKREKQRIKELEAKGKTLGWRDHDLRPQFYQELDRRTFIRKISKRKCPTM